ncbi:hypothetical protein MFRU_018g00200 [Monilinia fructicola]|nr:hypothetical protein MFRU_018g00200 [Monilinia fructicola]
MLTPTGPKPLILSYGNAMIGTTHDSYNGNTIGSTRAMLHFDISLPRFKRRTVPSLLTAKKKKNPDSYQKETTSVRVHSCQRSNIYSREMLATVL